MGRMLVDRSYAGGNGGAFYASRQPDIRLEDSGLLRVINCTADEHGGALYLEDWSETPPESAGFPLLIAENHARLDGGGT